MDVDDDKEPDPGKKKQVNVFLRDQERNIDDAGTNDGLAMPSLQADACSVADAAGGAVASAGDDAASVTDAAGGAVASAGDDAASVADAAGDVVASAGDELSEIGGFIEGIFDAFG
ncbi:MAG: hypothetical protein J5875_08815 [Paludibacteraceae bacterium]|nr:hypothetical protein [Paludibacteraceae bacterium]